jgi:hypothetical protein
LTESDEDDFDDNEANVPPMKMLVPNSHTAAICPPSFVTPSTVIVPPGFRITRVSPLREKAVTFDPDANGDWDVCQSRPEKDPPIPTVPIRA